MAAGERLGRLLPGGAVVELIGDLGAGKTVVARGLARGLGYSGIVTSPSFTVSRIYQLADGRQLHHYDFYRMSPGDITVRQMAEDILDPAVITVVEWASTVGDVLPADRIRVSLKANADSRKITISALGPKSKKIVERLLGKS